MNLRILKKLSARAAPYLTAFGDNRTQFRAEKGENYHGMMIRDRSCWDRSRCHPTFTGIGGDIVFDTRAGHRIVMRPPSHPLKGTVMVGATTGYYEPEWDEQCAYSALAGHVQAHFTDWEAYPEVGNSRRMRTPRDVFSGADAMLIELRLVA